MLQSMESTENSPMKNISEQVQHIQNRGDFTAAEEGAQGQKEAVPKRSLPLQEEPADTDLSQAHKKRRSNLTVIADTARTR